MQPSVPSTMAAVQQDEPGGRLVLREIPVPYPGANQVLVRMAAAPFNPSDLGALAGSTYSGVRSYPFTPGIEGSGRVVQAGEGLLPKLLMGRRIACSAPALGDGTYAEYMVTPASRCLPLLRDVTMEQGAMLLVNPLTALAIVHIARHGGHRAVVSTAAASALGGMLLRLGKRYNIPIVHLVRSAEQVDLVRSHGGEYILNSEDSGFIERLREMAQKLQASLLLDAIGGNMTQKLAEAAPYGSTILIYSRLSRKNIETDGHVWLSKNLHAHGWLLSNWLREKNIIQILLLARQAQSLLSSDLYSPVNKRLPLAAAQSGLEEYIASMTAGKILLVADPQEVPLDG